MTGSLRSAPFTAPRFIAVPSSGYAAEGRADVWLECLGSGRRLRVSRGNARELWVERTLHLDPRWCRNRVQLVASASNGTYWVATGTPFESTLLAWLKESAFVHLAIHAMAWLLLLGPGVAVAWLLGRGTEQDLPWILGVGIGAGYLQFFLVYHFPVLSHVLVLLVAGSMAASGWLAVRGLRRREALPAAVQPLALTFLLSLFCVALVYAGDVGAGTHDATYRFDPAVWSTDNQLPQMVAEALYQKRNLATLFVNWRVSDRPPLLTGVFLLGRPLWRVFVGTGENYRLLFYFYQITGMVASTFWVVPVWMLLGRAGLGSRRRIFVVLLLASLGPMLFNSVYIWPKMLAATLAGAGCLVLMPSRRIGRAGAWRDPLLGGALMGLGLMSHSGVVFGLPSAVLAALLIRRHRLVRTAVITAVTAALVVLPWLWWQRVENPPGNALTKFAFAGTYGFEQPEVGLAETVRTAYATLTVDRWLEMRAQAFKTLAGLGRVPEIEWLFVRDTDALGRLRLIDFAYPLPALRVMNVGWPILAFAVLTRVTRGRRAPATTATRVFAGSVAVGAFGIVLNAMTTWSVHILHTQSYLSLLLVAAGLCGSILLVSPWLRRIVAGAHASYFAIVWLWSPLRGAVPATGSLVVCTLAALALGVLALTADAEEGSPTIA